MTFSARDLRLTYADASGAIRAVDGVSLEVRQGERIGILGPSGSGKSSLLYLLAGLKRPTSGEVSYRGLPYGPMNPEEMAELRRRHFGFIFQNHFLIPYLTGIENVMAGGEGDGARILEELGVGHCRDRFPWQMSAGEKQRVAIARAVVHRPEVLFADEPTASLDRPNADMVMECLGRAAAGSTILMVTHDESILRGASRVLRMEAGRLIL